MARLYKSVLPSPALIAIVAAVGGLLALAAFTAAPASKIAWSAAGLAIVLALLTGLDLYLSLSEWRAAPLSLQRRLPHAFAVGEPVSLAVSIVNPGRTTRRGRYFELTDPTLLVPAMPLRFAIEPGKRETLEFQLTPTARGMKSFEAGQILLRSVLGLLDWNLRIGHPEARRVFPDFKRQAALAWMAGNRRLAQLGIKPVRRRGSGTDFDQLLDYRPGDPIRHIDWKATLKHGRPISRSFRDDRDQSVMFLLDCGRRMRADDTQSGIGATHFDQSLEALMLLAFVALSKGDAVGAMTFGTAEGGEKRFAPSQGPPDAQRAHGGAWGRRAVADLLRLHEGGGRPPPASAQAGSGDSDHQLPGRGFGRARRGDRSAALQTPGGARQSQGTDRRADRRSSP